MNRDIFELLAGAGTLHGVVLSFVLFSKRKYFPNIILGVLVLLISIELFTVNFDDETYLSFIKTLPDLFMSVINNLMFIYGPLFYLYVKSLLYGSKEIKKREWLHFLPFILITGFALIQISFNIGNEFDFLEMLTYTLARVIGFVYTVISFKMIKNYEKRVEGEFSNIELMNVRWLDRLTIVKLLIWGFSIASVIYVLINQTDGSFIDFVINILLTTFIYVVGYSALMHPGIFSVKAEEEIEEEAVNKDDNLDIYYKRVLKYMDEKRPYLDPYLTLNQLADSINIPSYLLSRVINSCYNDNFYTFINSYRVEEVKRRLKDEKYRDETILSIALDCGFNSKSTFNSLFKRFVLTTPSKYRKEAV